MGDLALEAADPVLRNHEFATIGGAVGAVRTRAPSPLAITHLYWPQLLMAAVLGLFYSWAYHRTGSLLAPIVAHNVSV